MTREELLKDAKNSIEHYAATHPKCVFCFGGYQTHATGCPVSRLRQAFGEPTIRSSKT